MNPILTQTNPTLAQKITTAVKNWWLSVLIGVLFIVMGIWVLATPVSSFISLSIFFGVLMFISGLTEVIFALANRDEIDNWGWYFAGALIDFLLGIVLVAYPGITMTILPLLLGFWLMFKGFSAIGISLDMRRYKGSMWGWLFFGGLLAVLFSFLIIANPIIGGISIVYMIALALVTIGIVRIALGLRLRSLHNFIKG